MPAAGPVGLVALPAQRAAEARAELRDAPAAAHPAGEEGGQPALVAAFFENFANFWRARSRLYQNEILQENMRSTAFFKLYKICILLHRCNLKNFAKNRFEKSAIFVKIQQKFCKFRKICKILLAWMCRLWVKPSSLYYRIIS